MVTSSPLSLWWMCSWCWLRWLRWSRWRRPPPGLPESFRASNPQLGPYSPSAQDSWGFFIVPLLLSLSFAVQYHFVFVHLGKNCPKTLGSSVTLIEKTLRHSRYFSLYFFCRGHIFVCAILSFEWVISFTFLSLVCRLKVFSPLFRCWWSMQKAFSCRRRRFQVDQWKW